MNAIEAIKKYKKITRLSNPNYKTKFHNRHSKIYAAIENCGTGKNLKWYSHDKEMENVTFKEIMATDWIEYDAIKLLYGNETNDIANKTTRSDKCKISRIFYDTEDLSQYYCI